MRPKTREMLNKAETLLLEEFPIFGKDLAKKCGLKPASGYRLIRLLREVKGIGIVPTTEGFVPSIAANARQATAWTRKMLGLHVSHRVAYSAAFKDIIKLYPTKERDEWIKATSFLMPKESALMSSMKFIQDKSESLGI